mgnify:CR=1 FL=1
MLNSAPSLPIILRHRVSINVVSDLINIFKRIWSFSRHDRPTFSELGAEIRKIHNFIGKDCNENFDVNFPIIQNPELVSIEGTDYVRHVNADYGLWKNEYVIIIYIVLTPFLG